MSASRGIGIVLVHREYSYKKVPFVSDEVPCILAMAPKIAKLEIKSETGYSVRRVVRWCYALFAKIYMQEYNKLAEKDKRNGY